jgi:hypothetical protein
LQHSSKATMEDLFAPTTRFRDFYRAREHDYDDDDEEMRSLVELELITGSSAEDTFLHCGFTWSDCYSFGHGKIVWMISPYVFFDLTRDKTASQVDYQLFLRYRPRVRSIAKEKCPWRRNLLLVWALGSVSSNPSLIWMFLSGNANVRLGPIPRKRKRAPNSDEKQGPPMS